MSATGAESVGGGSVAVAVGVAVRCTVARTRVAVGKGVRVAGRRVAVDLGVAVAA